MLYKKSVKCSVGCDHDLKIDIDLLFDFDSSNTKMKSYENDDVAYGPFLISISLSTITITVSTLSTLNQRKSY